MSTSPRPWRVHEIEHQVLQEEVHGLSHAIFDSHDRIVAIPVSCREDADVIVDAANNYWELSNAKHSPVNVATIRSGLESRNFSWDLMLRYGLGVVSLTPTTPREAIYALNFIANQASSTSDKLVVTKSELVRVVSQIAGSLELWCDSVLKSPAAQEDRSK